LHALSVGKKLLLLLLLQHLLVLTVLPLLSLLLSLQDNLGQRALHMSCVTMSEQQATEILPVLLRYGADPSDQCPMKTSAVALATRFGKKKNAAVLQAAIDALAAAPPAAPARAATAATGGAAEDTTAIMQEWEQLGIKFKEKK
jgi:hypothetical protein